ncbi:MAG: hypothetical protein FJ090_14555, partial [Deltaproteobacteria bacterium]|nr:hypothetical protein [Deltaproteobacteria bacterium]
RVVPHVDVLMANEAGGGRLQHRPGGEGADGDVAEGGSTGAGEDRAGKSVAGEAQASRT